MKPFALIYGSLHTPLQKKAIEQLSVILLDYTAEYPVCLPYDENADYSSYKCIFIGTKENNPYLRRNADLMLSVPESYAITVRNSTVMIEGYDDAGVLWGVMDFYNRYILRFEYIDHKPYTDNFLTRDTLPDFTWTSAPTVRQRGLWTWGHVIYDYRRYLDNMMKLKMNQIVIWNDFAPVNAKEIVDYAHSCGIRVIWGYAWLWGTDCSKFDLRQLEGHPQRIFDQFEAEYADTGADGIYFQTFTELWQDNIGGVLIAEAAADFVNQTANLFFQKYPDMEIQFGLHAHSVSGHLDFIRTVDPRIRIVWENCGAFPFSYFPHDVENFDETRNFVDQIACLRGPDERFGAVTKGLINLDWSKFRHMTGPHDLGVSSPDVLAKRAEDRKQIWRYIQSGWLIHSDKVLEMIQEMQRIKQGDLNLLALVEDGAFEENIMYPVALYAEMLWNCHAELNEIISNVSLRNYVVFA